MNGPTFHTRQSVQADYHTLWLHDPGTPPEPVLVWRNGLVDAQRYAMAVRTGIHTGAVTAEVDVRAGPPPGPDLADWDEIIDVSISSRQGRLDLHGPTSAQTLVIPLNGPGDYRVRVHARDRDTNIDGVANEPVEVYRFTIWPDALTSEVIHRATDGSTHPW